MRTFVARQIATAPTVLTGLSTGPCYLAIPARASHNWIDGVTVTADLRHGLVWSVASGQIALLNLSVFPWCQPVFVHRGEGRIYYNVYFTPLRPLSDARGEIERRAEGKSKRVEARELHGGCASGFA
jgi:hypothetical protein